MGGQSGPQKTTSGGFALKYYADVRMEVVRIGTLKDDDEEIIGHRTKINVVASKVALPQHCEMDLIYGKGFWIEADIVDAGVKARIIEKSGAWYSYKGDRLGQGRAAAAKMLTTNPETTAAIVAAVREVRGLTDAASV